MSQSCCAQFPRSDLLTRHKKTCGDPWVGSVPVHSMILISSLSGNMLITLDDGLAKHVQSRKSDVIFNIRATGVKSGESLVSLGLSVKPVGKVAQLIIDPILTHSKLQRI